MDYSAKLGLDSRIPVAPTGQEGMQALRGEGLARRRADRLKRVQTPLK